MVWFNSLAWLCALSTFWTPVQTQRVVPDWRQVPGEVNWFEGCGLGNYDIRGAIAAGLEQNKVETAANARGSQALSCLPQSLRPTFLHAKSGRVGLQLLEMHDVLHGKRILCGRMLEQSHT
eukprot:symbB.v1.2.039260.t1/scaffold6445.1/size18044/2